jgi:tRNA (mo5U34)-methyltransferase
MTDLDDLRTRVSRIRWHHSIDLGNGITTPGHENTARKLSRLELPASFAGKTVLDVGAWDGFFSFEAERRGAARVLATDSYCWSSASGFGKQGFDLAKAALGSRVEDMQIDVLELSPERVGVFDVTLFLGVLYHLKHPLLALERVASVTQELLICETVVDLLHTRRPAIAFYETDELARDPTNWCAPNTAALAAMLRTVGFTRIDIVSGVRPLWFRVARAARQSFERKYQFGTLARTDRVVVHAWKPPGLATG